MTRGFFLSVCILSGMAHGAAVGYRETRNETVAAGTATLGATTLDGSATVVKDGEGVLNASLSDVRGPAGSTLAVGRGTLALTLDAAGGVRTGETGLGLPESAKSKLGLWLDASLRATKPELFPGATSNDESGVEHAYVDKWLDARESSPAVPERFYAHANFSVNWAGVSTEYVLFGGTTPAIWFGGHGNGGGKGRYMNVMKGGAVKALDGVCHLFAVHIIDTTFGFIFGDVMHIGGFGSAADTLNAPWWHPTGGRDEMYTGNFFVNGALTEGHIEHPKKGPPQLMEYDFGSKSLSIVDLFRDGNNHSASVGYRAGGDYLCEVLFFTNRLTAAETASINDYLKRKWNLDSGVSPALSVAEGAVLEVSAGNAEVQDAAFKGPGRIVKTGSSPLRLRADAAETAGSLRVDEGTVELAAPVPVEVQAGDRVTADIGADGPSVSVEPDAVDAGMIVKEGGEAVHLSALPEGVTNLAVNGGAIHFDAPNTNGFFRASDHPEITVQNASFETWSGSQSSWYQVVTASGVDGWYTIDNCSNCKMIDYDNWYWANPGDGKGKGQYDKYRSQYAMSSRPPDGKRCLFFRCDKDGAYTYVTIPSDGDYEITLHVSGRENTGYLAFPLDISLSAENNCTPVHEFGRVLYSWVTGFERVRRKATNVKAGRYRLMLKGAGLSPTADEMILVVDDVRLRKVPAVREDIWPIPGGDFEKANFFTRTDAVCGLFAANAQTGWTMVQPDAGDAAVRVGLTTYFLGCNNTGKFFSGNTPFDSTSVELYFRCSNHPNGRAVTTFTPPAGTWYVRADAARYKANDSHLTAKVKVGEGAETALGTLEIVGDKMKPVCWPECFTVDGTQPVTLSLVYSSSLTEELAPGCMVDNIVLSRRDPTATLVANGGFEDASSWYAGWNRIFPDSVDAAYAIGYTGLAEDVARAFCSDCPPSGGARQVVMVNRGLLTQEVDFKDDGWYELSWWSHRRLDRDYRPALCAWLAWTDADGKACTNVIGCADVKSTNHSRQSFLFRPPAAGTCTLGIQGARTTGQANPAAECVLDLVSVKPVADFRASDFPMDPNLKIRVSAGARLHLGYEGTNVIRHLTLGGRGRHGVISAETDPDFISGPGMIYSEAVGMLLLFK